MLTAEAQHLARAFLSALEGEILVEEKAQHTGQDVIGRARHPVGAVREVVQPEHDRSVPTSVLITPTTRNLASFLSIRPDSLAHLTHLLGLAHQIHRPALGLQIGAREILPEDADAQQLHPAEKQDDAHRARQPADRVAEHKRLDQHDRDEHERNQQVSTPSTDAMASGMVENAMMPSSE